jgi:hypothetical protein
MGPIHLFTQMPLQISKRRELFVHPLVDGFIIFYNIAVRGNLTNPPRTWFWGVRNEWISWYTCSVQEFPRTDRSDLGRYMLDPYLKSPSKFIVPSEFIVPLVLIFMLFWRIIDLLYKINYGILSGWCEGPYVFKTH